MFNVTNIFNMTRVTSYLHFDSFFILILKNIFEPNIKIYVIQYGAI